MVETMKGLTIGEPNSLLGPIQNKMQYDRINRFPAELSSGSGEHGHALISTDHSFEDRSGYFIGPHIVSEPKHDSAIVTEEQFGKNSPPP
jgi:acyl-CoA reductase-like NAD-dependent aldehyde dehydrogenase